MFSDELLDKICRNNKHAITWLIRKLQWKYFVGGVGRNKGKILVMKFFLEAKILQNIIWKFFYSVLKKCQLK